MKPFSKYIIIVSVVLGLFTSCRKKEQEVDDEKESVTENFLATNLTNDMASISDEAARTNNVSSFKTEETTAILSSCATLHFDTLNHLNPDSITVNFGTANCMGNDLRYRRGSLLIIYNGKYKDSLTTITVTPINYFVNNNGISGTKTIKNLGRNALGNLVYQFIDNVTITKADNGGTFTWTSNRQREWIAGQTTLFNWLDDKYAITGSAIGTNSNGRSFTSVITKPLIRDMSIGCRKYFTSGVISHTPNNKPSRIIDFGDGGCDNKATVTINGKIYEISLN
jgi:hypothetical protein